MTKLFHGTYKEFNPGDTIRAGAAITGYPHVCSVLDNRRPSGRPNRTVAVFATDSVVAASAFIDTKSTDVTAIGHVYEVTMPIFHKAPMRIIFEIDRRMKASEPYDALVGEYWIPTGNWLFWEYFGPEYTVVNEVPIANFGLVAKFKSDYVDRDSPLAKTF